MRCHRRHLHFIDAVVLLADPLEVVFPVKGIHDLPILIEEQKAAHPIHHRLRLRRPSSGNDSPEGFFHFACHRQHPGPVFRLGLFDIVAAPYALLKLTLDIDRVFLKINIGHGQPAELGDPQSRPEENQDAVIVSGIVLILSYELQELSLLVPWDAQSGESR